MEVTNEIPVELTQKFEIEEEKPIEKIAEEQLDLSSVKEDQPEFSIDDSMIEEKLKKLLPEIVSKIKSEISEEMQERSRISSASFRKNEDTQPIISEDSFVKKENKKEEKMDKRKRLRVQLSIKESTVMAVDKEESSASDINALFALISISAPTVRLTLSMNTLS